MGASVEACLHASALVTTMALVKSTEAQRRAPVREVASGYSLRIFIINIVFVIRQCAAWTSKLITHKQRRKTRETKKSKYATAVPWYVQSLSPLLYSTYFRLHIDLLHLLPLLHLFSYVPNMFFLRSADIKCVLLQCAQ